MTRTRGKGCYMTQSPEHITDAPFYQYAGKQESADLGSSPVYKPLSPLWATTAQKRGRVRSSLRFPVDLESFALDIPSHPALQHLCPPTLYRRPSAGGRIHGTCRPQSWPRVRQSRQAMARLVTECDVRVVPRTGKACKATVQAPGEAREGEKGWTPSHRAPGTFTNF